MEIALVLLSLDSTLWEKSGTNLVVECDGLLETVYAGKGHQCHLQTS